MGFLRFNGTLEIIKRMKFLKLILKLFTFNIMKDEMWIAYNVLKMKD